MSPRVRRLLAFAALLGLAAGCAHRPSAPPAPLRESRAPVVSTSTRAAAEETPAPAARRSVPGTPFTRARPAAGLEPMVVVTTQVAHDDLFLHALGGTGPAYVSANRLYRGQRAFILPIVRNYAFDALERSDLTFEITIQKPDGTPDGAPLSATLWQEAVPGPDLVLFPSTTITFFAEPRDPLGDYRVLIRLHDHLGGDSREVAHVFTLEDYAPPALPTGFDPDLWFHNYYLAPAPELALPALPRFFEKLPADKRAGAIPPLLGFYDQILADNTWLLPAFAARLREAPPDEAFALSLVLGFHLRGRNAPPEGVDAALWDRLADFRTHAWPADPDAPLLQAAQLDALWGRFFASARYAPIRRLVEPLAHTADLGAAERWRRARPAPGPEDPFPMPDLEDPATPPALRREILLRTALWSLRANARQHPLVRGYLEQTLRAGDLAPGIRVLLERALAADAATTPGAPAPTS